MEWAQLLRLLLLLYVNVKMIICDDSICSGMKIAKSMCERLFPASVLNPQDIRQPIIIPNTTCFQTKEFNTITITNYSWNGTIRRRYSCREIPSNITQHGFGDTTHGITDMVVRNTHLVTLEKYSFVSWIALETLQISMNFRCKSIQPGAFENLTSLWNLTISDHPYLGPLQHDTFKGLINLRELRYLRNNVKKMSSVTLALNNNVVPSMSVLDFTGNNISHIHRDDFKPMKNTSLNTLIISLTKTEWVDKAAFDPLGPLVHLDLSQNNLNVTVLTELVEHLTRVNPNLTHLTVAENLLFMNTTPFLESVARTESGIVFLNLQNNHLGIMNSGYFPKMPKLLYLDLTNVMIDNIPNGVISYELMPNLQYLYLSQNIFSSITPSMVTKTVSRFYIANNNNVPPWNTYFKINKTIFLEMPELELLDLTGNILNIVRKEIFVYATALKVLLLRNSFLNEIEEGAFSTNSKLFYLDLSYNKFALLCPFTKEIFRGLDNLMALDLSNSHISNFEFDDVFSGLKKLKYLSLRMNSIYKLDPNVFANLPRLEIIDLRYNILVFWTERIFQNNPILNTTLLDYNHIDTITESMMNDFSGSKHVSLYGNSLVCDCKLVDVVAKTLQSYEDVNKLPFANETITCLNGRSEIDLIDYLKYILSSKKCVNTEIYLIITLTLVALIITGTAVFVAYYYYKYDVHFWFLRMKRKLGLLHYIRGDKTEMKVDNCTYDAFVSYCVEDEKFVEKMVYILETDCSRFKLCVFERDFKVGDVLTDKILECMESSRKTILVLTESFAKSQWCCWEMYIAQSRSISLSNLEPDDPLILIKKSVIPDSLMTPTLRYLMKTRVYLEWHDSPVRQKIFWEQLKNSLKS